MEPKTQTEKVLTAQVNKTIADAPQTISDQPLAQKVVEAIRDNPNIAVVNIKPWYLQQQNLATLVAGLAAIAALWGFNIDAATQVEIVGAILAVYGAYTTWRKNIASVSVTPTVAAKAMPPAP